MHTFWQATIWQQYGASIDMLENAIVACPDNVWGDRTRFPEFWYVTYHTLFFLDYYLHETEASFAPPPPFTMSELDPAGVMPERVFSKEEMLTYLRHGRNKCRNVIVNMTEDKAREQCPFNRRDITNAGLLLYNMRHVQHHTAQLNLILRQTIDSAPLWVSRAKQPLQE